VSDRFERLYDLLNPFSHLIPINPGKVVDSAVRLALASPGNASQFWASNAEMMINHLQLFNQTLLKVLGLEADDVMPGDPRDGRFADEAWDEYLAYNYLKQAYLINAQWLLSLAGGLEGLDRKQKHQVRFYIGQLVDATSPSNFVLTNPVVLREIMRTGGRNLMVGFVNFLKDLRDGGGIKMTDTDAFEVGGNLATTSGKVVFRNELMELIQYAPTTDQVYQTPLLMVPHWINKYYIMDLTPDNSMVRFLVDSGVTLFMISWKNPDASMRDISMEDYMRLGPLAAIDVVKDITGESRVNMGGYCIGGTLLSATLAYLKAIDDHSVNSASFIVSLQDFSEVGDLAVFIDEGQLFLLDQQMAQQGYLEGTQMSTAFNLLRANDLIWQYVVNNYLLGKQPAAFDLLYWNSDSTRMPYKMHSYYLRNMYLENNLVKPGALEMLGVPIDMSLIDQDIFDVATMADHIVPWKSAFKMRQYVSGDVHFVLGESGHVAGGINPPGGKKVRPYWYNPSRTIDPDEWFDGAEKTEDSWWVEWLKWLGERSGEKVAARTPGSGAYPSLADAPGIYVLEN
jgi:polyhydroxyalkanoate synthase